MERFIVGIDGSDNSAAALRWALRESEIRDARVTAVLAWNFLDQYGIDGEQTFEPHYGEEDARRALDAAVARTLGDDADQVLCDVVCDLPATALLDAAKDADLLILGARGLGQFRGLVLGSVSQRCLEHAPCPVMVVHGNPAGRVERGRVVVGVDGSGPSALALAWAAEEARLRGAELEVVHAWELPSAPEFTFDAAFDAAHRAADDLVDQMLLAVDPRPDDVVRRVVQAPPVLALTDAAAGADLVVVGSRGRGGFSGLLLGSVSHQVSRHADRPVVVVPRSVIDTDE